MTEKTNTGDLVLDRNGYFHVVYLISDEEKLYGMSNYYIGHIDNCTLVLTDEKLQELRKPKDRQPTLAVGEYYLDKDVNRIVKIENHETGYTEIVYLSDGKLLRSVLYNLEDYFEKWNPATAEQIATFQRAEHFSSKGRKLDEFHVGDRVNCSEIPFDNGYYMGDLKIERFVGKQFVAESETSFYPFNLDEINKVTLIQTAEELQEVEHGN